MNSIQLKARTGATVATADRVVTGADARAGLADRVDRVVDRWVSEGRIVGLVATIAREGEVVYERAAGLSDREAGVPVATDSVFRLASMTKTIVSAAALALVEEGRMSLDDRVTAWLPYFVTRTADGVRREITIRQLMTHTSGLGYSFLRTESDAYSEAGVDEGLAGYGITLEENLRRLASVPLHFVPGTEWCYSPSTDVLGGVIERVAGSPLPEAVARYVTGPLDMSDTAFLADASRLTAAYRDGAQEPVRMHGVDAYVPFERPMPTSPAVATDPSAWPSGGGGMSGTAADYLRFLEALRTGGVAILTRESAGALGQNAIGDLRAWTEGDGWGFGLGAAVLVDPGAAGSPQSAGTWAWGGALGAHWFVDPEARLTVVVVTNTSVAGVMGAFPEELRDAIYAAEV